MGMSGCGIGWNIRVSLTDEEKEMGATLTLDGAAALLNERRIRLVKAVSPEAAERMAVGKMGIDKMSDQFNSGAVSK